MRIELPVQKKWVYQEVIAMRWGDMDAMGHLNNTSYFRFLETVRINWFTKLHCAPDPKGEGPVIVNAFCNFLIQLEYPCDVLVKMYVSDPQRSSFESWATLERVDQPGVVHAEGGATTVWVNFPLQKSAPLPDWMRAHLV
jgi:acyl-CoA thioester hydrolase